MNRSRMACLAFSLLAISLTATHWSGALPRKTVALVAGNHVIEIKGMAFNPALITVHKGDRITFLNHDIVTHDITEAKKGWKSAPLPVGKSWSLTVNQSASYYCSIHPVMKGKIIVK